MAATARPAAAMTVPEARRLALRAQGIDRPRPSGRVDRRHLHSVVDRLHILQIDSVNVLSRAHYVPLFSRLGPYDTSRLDAMAGRASELFEYWGHVASLLPVRLHPLLRWRMEGDHAWGGPRGVVERRPDLVAAVEAEVLAHGPVPASAVGDGTGRTEADVAEPDDEGVGLATSTAGDLTKSDHQNQAWWGWSDTKSALEYLFHAGRISAKRSPTFERLYCAPDLAVPAEVLHAPTPDPEDAQRELLYLAAQAHGVGTARDLADVWRLRTRDAARLLDELVEDGALEPVAVDGWRDLAYRAPEIPQPRRVDACALVSPFDSVMWERDRIARLHDFEYRIEIYVPAAKRRYGYYVYPFLLGDTYVARVDLKADRAAGTLLVQSAWAEGDLDARGTDRPTTATALAGELATLATWLGLDDIAVADRGDLSPDLRRAMG